jgi:hypothetical protein
MTTSTITSTFSPDELAELSHEVPFTRVFDASARVLPHSRARPRLVARRDNRRKLLEQVEFLTRYGSCATTVVVVGYPGTHFSLLRQLFPKHEFRIWNTSELKPEDIQRLGETPVLLMLALCGEHLEDGLELQRDLVERLRPQMALMRFQPPRGSPSFEYLAGTLFWPVWGSAEGCDVSLMTDGAATHEYDVSTHYDALHRFNLCTRQQAYQHLLPRGVYGLDFCYDCTAEIHIWKSYLKSVGRVYDAASIATLMNHASVVCTERLPCGGHGRIRTAEPTLERLGRL